MPITLVATGTLGDVLPFAELARGLQRAGAEVRLAAHPPFAELARERGLPFAPLDGDVTPLLHADPHALAAGAGPLRGLLASWRFVAAARPLYARLLESAWDACRGSRAVVGALPTWWAAEVAEALGVPFVLAPLQPITPTAAWPSPLLPLPAALGPRLNRLSHQALAALVRAPWLPQLRAWRSRTLGLTARAGSPLLRALAPGAPVVYGYSPLVAPPPADWPAGHVPVGYWRGDGAPEPSPELRAFVERGLPPVYIGFGSMGVAGEAEDARLALAALRLAGRRGVLLGGHAAGRAAAGRDDMLVVPAAPHGWLLPRAAAAVHHGGAGTTAAGLLAGAPAVVVAFAADQAFWGRRLAALGAGPEPAARSRLTPERLAALIEDAAGRASYRARAAELGALLHEERGVERGAEAVLRHAGLGR